VIRSSSPITAVRSLGSRRWIRASIGWRSSLRLVWCEHPRTPRDTGRRVVFARRRPSVIWCTNNEGDHLRRYLDVAEATDRGTGLRARGRHLGQRGRRGRCPRRACRGARGARGCGAGAATLSGSRVRTPTCAPRPLVAACTLRIRSTATIEITEGKHLARVAEPDEVSAHTPMSCRSRGADLADAMPAARSRTGVGVCGASRSSRCRTATTGLLGRLRRSSRRADWRSRSTAAS